MKTFSHQILQNPCCILLYLRSVSTPDPQRPAVRRPFADRSPHDGRCISAATNARILWLLASLSFPVETTRCRCRERLRIISAINTNSPFAQCPKTNWPGQAPRTRESTGWWCWVPDGRIVSSSGSFSLGSTGSAHSSAAVVRRRFHRVLKMSGVSYLLSFSRFSAVYLSYFVCISLGAKLIAILAPTGAKIKKRNENPCCTVMIPF